MPTYRAFPLDIEGDIVSPTRSWIGTATTICEPLARPFWLLGLCADLARHDQNVPPTAVQTGVPSGRTAITVNKAEEPAVGPASSPQPALALPEPVLPPCPAAPPRHESDLEAESQFAC